MNTDEPWWKWKQAMTKSLVKLNMHTLHTPTILLLGIVTVWQVFTRKPVHACAQQKDLHK